MFGIKQAAEKAGISEGLLIFWISVGKFKPSVDLTTSHYVFPDGRAGIELAGWNRFFLSDKDIEQLRKMVEGTADKKAKVEAAHVRGQHYSVQEVAQLWGLGIDKIRELFENEPGVIKLQSPPKKGKRRYTTLRIPENVAERVQRRLS